MTAEAQAVRHVWLNHDQKRKGSEVSNPEDQATNKPKNAKSVLRSIFDSLVNIVVVVALISMVLWNADVVWQIEAFENILQNTFPEKYEYEQLRIQNGEKNSRLLTSYKKERDDAIIHERQMRFEYDSMKNQVDSMCKYYDESLRLIQILKDEIEPKDFKALIEVQPRIVKEIVDPTSPAQQICQ